MLFPVVTFIIWLDHTRGNDILKRRIIIGLFLLLLAILGILAYINLRTQYNAEGTVGNSSGNLLNGGLICEYNNKIYFSNPMDDGALYVMNSDCSEYKKLQNDKANYINVAGKYLYYTRKNGDREKQTKDFFLFSNSGLYRINKDGKAMITLSMDISEVNSLSGNYVYYQRYNKKSGLQLYKTKLDGKENSLLLEDPISPHAIQGNTLYFTNIKDDHYIKSMDLTTGSIKTIYEGNCSSCIVTDQYIFFLSNTDDYAIGRVNLDGSNPTIIVKERCSTFNISPSGTYLYYQVDGGEQNRICMLNLETKESKTILMGDYSNISTTSDYVFFQKFGTNEVYIMDAGNADSLSIFNPPVLKD